MYCAREALHDMQEGEFGDDQNRGESLKRKAEELNDRHMHDKISAHLGQDMDLVAVDVKYLAPCVNSYLKKRL